MICYYFGPFLLNPGARILLRDYQPVEVTAKVFETLVILVENRGRVLSKDELLSALWPNTLVEEANLTQSISTLRKVLNDKPKEHRYVATIPRQGYSFVASVVEKQSSEVSQALAQDLGPSVSSRSSIRLGTPTFYYLFALVLALVFAGSSLVYLSLRKGPQQSVFYSSAPLTNYIGREICPSFSPDGERVAFAWDGLKRDNFDIYVKQIGVGSLLRLTSGVEPDISPAWSADGRTIAFLHVVDGSKAEVSLIPAIGPALRRILATLTMRGDLYYRFRFLSWSPDGKWLAVSDAPDTVGVGSLFFLSTETGEKRRVTFPSVDYDDFDPAFSPDMSHLAFVRYSGYGASASDLYIIGLSGDLVPQGEPQRLTAFNGRVTSPVWTPDGLTILFTRREGAGSHSLWRINLTGNRQIEPLAIAADSSSSMTLSRSGNKIVYTRESSNVNIWAADLNSTASNRADWIRPFIASTSEEDNPQFSPDGKHIAYQSSRSGKTEIWVCDQDGSNSRQLTNMAAVVSGFARWSPDGKEVVFHSRPNGSASLYVIDAAGGTPKRLTSEIGNDISPSWSHDGKWIYFASRRTGELCIWKMPAGGGPALQLTKLSGFSPLESKDGQYLYYTTLPRLALRRLPLSGGADKEILSGVAGDGSSYAIADNGIYFIRVASGREKQELSFFSFATRQIRTIVALAGRASLGLALSPDEHMILFGQTDQQDSDLMLVDRFR